MHYPANRIEVSAVKQDTYTDSLNKHTIKNTTNPGNGEEYDFQRHHIKICQTPSFQIYIYIKHNKILKIIERKKFNQ